MTDPNNKPVDWQNPFTSEDFFGLDGADAVDMKQRANARFRELIEKAPKVYSRLGLVWTFAEFEGDDTHSARLIDIRELGHEKEIGT